MEFVGEDGAAFFYSYASDESSSNLAEDVQLIRKPLKVEEDFFNQASSGVSTHVKAANKGSGGGGAEEKNSVNKEDSSAKLSSSDTLGGTLAESSFSAGDESEVLEFKSWWNESAGGNNPTGKNFVLGWGPGVLQC